MQAETHACEADANVTASATATDVSATPSSVHGKVLHLSILICRHVCIHVSAWQGIRLAFQPSPSVSACVLPHRRVDACTCVRVCCRTGVWMHAFVGSTCRQMHAQRISVLRLRTSAYRGRMDACICRQHMSERIAAAHVRAHCHLHVSGRPANMCERCFLHKPFCFFWHNGVDAACGTRATCVRALSVRR